MQRIAVYFLAAFSVFLSLANHSHGESKLRSAFGLMLAEKVQEIPRSCTLKKDSVTGDFYVCPFEPKKPHEVFKNFFYSIGAFNKKILGVTANSGKNTDIRHSNFESLVIALTKKYGKPKCQIRKYTVMFPVKSCLIHVSNGHIIALYRRKPEQDKHNLPAMTIHFNSSSKKENERLFLLKNPRGF